MVKAVTQAGTTNGSTAPVNTIVSVPGGATQASTGGTSASGGGMESTSPAASHAGSHEDTEPIGWQVSSLAQTIWSGQSCVVEHGKPGTGFGA